MTSPISTLNSSTSEEPEAYRIGTIPFLGTTIYLDSRPLVPRPETEWWVEAFVRTHPSGRVLDLFAGSGCVGVAVLWHTTCTVDFGEREVRHLATIERNIRENGIDPARTHVIETDVFSKLPFTYDFILANPPYLSRARIERVEDSVLTYEPQEALFAGDDGFHLIEATIVGTPAHLAHGGALWIEHEPEHAPRILESAAHLKLEATNHKDQYGVLRYSVILKP